MTYKVVFRRAAQREFADAALWYEERRGGPRAEFASEVNRAIESAVQNPTRFPIMHRGVRCVRARRYALWILSRTLRRQASRHAQAAQEIER